MMCCRSHSDVPGLRVAEPPSLFELCKYSALWGPGCNLPGYFFSFLKIDIFCNPFITLFLKRLMGIRGKSLPLHNFEASLEAGGAGGSCSPGELSSAVS